MRRMRGKCPEGSPSSVTYGDSFPQKGEAKAAVIPAPASQPDKLEVIALLLLYLSQNTFYYKCYCYKGSYKGIVV